MMDVLTFGTVILAGGVAAGILVLRDRWGQRRRVETPVLPAIHRNPPAVRQQGNLDLDQQTRFIEQPQRKQYRLLNDAEQALYHRLCEAMPNMRIFAQIGVAQLAQLRGRHEARLLTPMAGRGVDFVVCNQDFGIVAAIELAWPMATADREAEKREALKKLGIPLIVFRPNDLPDAEAVSLEIASAIIQRNRMEAERT